MHVCACVCGGGLYLCMYKGMVLLQSEIGPVGTPCTFKGQQRAVFCF